MATQLYVPLPTPVTERRGFATQVWQLFFQSLASAINAGLTQLTGDVTAGPGGGPQAATIANDAVTYAKMQNVSAASKLLGRGSAAGAGNVEEITLGTGLSMSATTINSLGGDVVGPGAATDGAPALFDGTTGKLIKNSTPTGTGNPVMQTSPTLTTPLLGTPTSGNLSNCTAYPIGSVAGLGANVATFLATPTSANLAAAVSDETGTGLAVFATSPTLTTPILGVAAATSINKVGFTAPTTAATFAFSTDNATFTMQGTDTYVGRATTDTLTNKRITKRVITATDAVAVTPNTDNADVTYQLNTQAGGTLTINNDTGTPTNTQEWTLKVKSSNVQTFAWDTIYVGGTVALPTATTGGGKIDYFNFVYDSVTPKWDYVSSALGF